LVNIPSLTDQINHMARLGVVANLPHDPLLARFYTIEWNILPNLGMDITLPYFIREFGVYPVSQVFVLTMILLIATGVCAIQSSIYGTVSLSALVPLVFMYNKILLWGFTNFLFGLGIALWGIAAWIALRRKAPWARGAVSLIFILLLFFCHLFALGLYGLTLFCYEASWMWARRFSMSRRKLLADMFTFAGPFLMIALLMSASPTAALSTESAWVFWSKLYGLYYAFGVYNKAVDVLTASLVLAFGAWVYYRRMLHVHSAGVILFILGGITYLAMPWRLFGSDVADARLPIAIAFILAGFTRIQLERSKEVMTVVLGIFLLVVMRMVTVVPVWLYLDNVYADIRRSFDLIEPGSTILSAWAAEIGPQHEVAIWDHLSYVPCLAMFERSSFVSMAFTNPGQVVLRVKEPYRKMASSSASLPTADELVAAIDDPQSLAGDRAYLEGWPQRFDYLYILGFGQYPNPVPKHLSILHEGEGFKLYRVE
jgi:hypothetical protein